MLRRSFRILSAISLLLCLAVAGLWVRSYAAWDLFTRADKVGSHIWIVSASGWFHVSLTGNCPVEVPWTHTVIPNRLRLAIDPVPEIRGSDGIVWYQMIGDARVWFPSKYGPTFRVPYGLVVFGAASYPVATIFSAVRARRRLLVGQCPRCGYDLRASPERCPECGKDVDPRMDTKEHESESARIHS